MKNFKITLMLSILLCCKTLVFSQDQPTENALFKGIPSAVITKKKIKENGGIIPNGMRIGATSYNYSILDHITIVADTSRTPYLSTTYSLEFAANWSTRGFGNTDGYVYAISPSSNFIDVSRALRQYYPQHLRRQQEVAAMGIIHWRQIQGWYHITRHPQTRETVIGRFVRNPDYDHRFDNRTISDTPERYAGFPRGHAAWQEEPWSNYATCGEPCASSSQSAFRKRSLKDCGPLICNNKLQEYFDDKKRKLVFRNLNYEDLNIQILLKNRRDVYFPNFSKGNEFILSYDNATQKYFYEGSEVQSIDLDNTRHPIGFFDKHDNMDFSWTGNNTITYKPKNLYNPEILIDEYKDLSKTQYREIRDQDGINGGSPNAIISTYSLMNVQFIEVRKWGTRSFDVNKLKKVVFKNVSYDDIHQKRIRLGNNAWDLWPQINKGYTISFDYQGNGKITHQGSILQQIDMYWTDATTYYSGDEIDFSWYNPNEVNYRPYWSQSWNNIPTLTLVDFKNGYLSSYVDSDGIQGKSPQMYLKVHISNQGKTLNIELHGRANQSVHMKNYLNEDHFSEEINSIEIFPNPSSTHINIKSSKHTNMNSYGIYDLKGALIKEGILEEKSNPIKIDVSTLQTGMYLVSIFNNKKLINTQKIVIKNK